MSKLNRPSSFEIPCSIFEIFFFFHSFIPYDFKEATTPRSTQHAAHPLPVTDRLKISSSRVEEETAMRTRWIPACALLAALGLGLVAERAWARRRCSPPPPPVRYEERTEIRYRPEYRTAYRDVQRTVYRCVPETREREIQETVMGPTWREVDPHPTVSVPETHQH